MFLSPKFAPPPAVPTSQPAPPVVPVQHTHAPACHCQTGAPARRTAPTLGVIAGGAAVVVTVGVVLTALLVAVTVAAVSVAVVAVVLRSLLTPPRQR
ncbi:hypothetical protein [Streptomyces sp. HPF1205]|uniref:hypothetical protein n=1 Tax=Streptomyces sp. HPF1205 TaxID=2873262 RepID=UPI001CEDE7EE|nr:hypothetical protein [Streptomyces sp. HPF1205]